MAGTSMLAKSTLSSSETARENFRRPEVPAKDVEKQNAHDENNKKQAVETENAFILFGLNFFESVVSATNSVCVSVGCVVLSHRFV